LNIGVIIQARTGSTRLPKKVLKKIGDRNILEHILFRLNKIQNKVRVVIATSDLEENNQIEVFCYSNKIDCFRGSEQNVLERYYLCAKKNNFDCIVRLTGDNPFVDIEELDNLINLHIKSKSDYSRSFAVLPKGVGSEIFSFDALEQSYFHGKNENHKEHVNEYIEENEDKFKVSELKVPNEKNRPEINLTVDTPDDYKKACFIVKNSSSEYIATKEAVKLCLQYA
jgi:spore coat polysaccharide biosynthesis protein SpsF